MNREKRLNKADRKKKPCSNDSLHCNGDHNCAVDRYQQRTSAVDVNNIEMMARPHCQQNVPDMSGYDGYLLMRLNSGRLNADTDSVVSERDLLPFLYEAGCCPSELYQVSNNDAYQRRQKCSNRKKKKETTHSLEFGRTVFPSAAVPVSTEDRAAGFVDRQMRTTDDSSGRQHYTGMWYSQPNTSQVEPFYTEDHLLVAAPVAANVLASEKVYSVESNYNEKIEFVRALADFFPQIFKAWKVLENIHGP